MITDRKKKVKAFVDQIEKIVNMDINKVYELTKLSRKNNMETLINIVSSKPPYLDDLKQWSLVFNSPLVMKWE